MNPAPGSTFDSFDPSRTNVVILGARNEGRLLWLERRLLAAGIGHIAIREPDAPYGGQLMAIGLLPGERAALHGHVKDFNILRGLDEPVTVA